MTRRVLAGTAIAMLAAVALGARRPPVPQALAVGTEARGELRQLWMASVAAHAERVACLASAIDGDTLRILRLGALGSAADSEAVSAGASLEACGPPAWQGTVHTHLTLREDQPAPRIFSGADRGVMLMWWRRWNADGTFCLVYAADAAHCEIDGSSLVILPSVHF